MLKLIDFHCHIDLYKKPTSVVDECVACGVHVLSVTTTPRAWRQSLALINHKPRIHLALGLHPEIAHTRAEELPLFEALLPEAHYIGEVGLDGSPELRQHHAAQRRVLDVILESCQRAGGRPLSLHSRRAATAVLDAMERWPGAGTPVLHWFSGNRNELERAIALGCWFSVGPGMLNSKKGQEIAALLPKKRTLTETDGPFGKISGHQLRPCDVQLAVTLLAKVWRLPTEEAASSIIQNFRMLNLIHA